MHSRTKERLLVHVDAFYLLTHHNYETSSVETGRESRESVIDWSHVGIETIKALLDISVTLVDIRHPIYQIIDGSDDTVFHGHAGLLQG